MNKEQAEFLVSCLNESLQSRHIRVVFFDNHFWGWQIFRNASIISTHGLVEEARLDKFAQHSETTSMLQMLFAIVEEETIEDYSEALVRKLKKAYRKK